MAIKHLAPQFPQAAEPVFGADRPWLAPLAGYSDLPFRLLCRQYGAMVCVSEMISARGLYHGSRRTEELLASAPGDTPLVIQLFGGEPEIMGHAVASLVKSGWRWFDCNLGCSVRKMLRQNAGASLLGSPETVLEIARAMIAAAATAEEPAGVGFKLRLGLGPGRPVLPDLALRLEDAGAAWITLHPRYASQGFTGRANWDELARLAGRLGIPLLASGDLFCARDGIDCLAATGATGVMYARGALRDPAIFADHKNLARGLAPKPKDAGALRAMIDAHLWLARKYCNYPNTLLRMRSILPRYARLLPGVNELRKALCACEDWDGLNAILDRHLGQAPGTENLGDRGSSQSEEGV